MSETTEPRNQSEEIQWEQVPPATIEDAFISRDTLVSIAKQLGYDGGNVAEIHLTPTAATIRTVTREDGEWKFREHTRLVR